MSQGLKENSQLSENGKQLENSEKELDCGDFAGNTEQGESRDQPDPDIRSWAEKEQLQLLLENTNDYFAVRDQRGGRGPI